MLRPEWTVLEEALAEFHRFYTEDKQPPKSIANHHGWGTHVGGTLYVSSSPDGISRKPPRPSFWPQPEPKKRTRKGVLIFQMAQTEWYDVETDRHGPPIDPFTEAEVNALRDAATAAGLKVGRSWNGVGFHSVSFELTGGIGATHQYAVGRYHDACPVHGHPFCGTWQASGESEKNCTYMPDGYARAIDPNLPYEAAPAPGMPEPSEDDRNLEAVLRALAAVTPLLAELGVHPGTVVAGKRGHIDGEPPGRLEFVYEEGHGVLLPAEVAEFLVGLAVEAQTLKTDLGM